MIDLSTSTKIGLLHRHNKGFLEKKDGSLKRQAKRLSNKQTLITANHTLLSDALCVESKVGCSQNQKLEDTRVRVQRAACACIWHVRLNARRCCDCKIAFTPLWTRSKVPSNRETCSKIWRTNITGGGGITCPSRRLPLPLHLRRSAASLAPVFTGSGENKTELQEKRLRHLRQSSPVAEKTKRARRTFTCGVSLHR